MKVVIALASAQKNLEDARYEHRKAEGDEYAARKRLESCKPEEKEAAKKVWEKAKRDLRDADLHLRNCERKWADVTSGDPRRWL